MLFLPNVFRLLLQSARMRFISETASSFGEPEPMRIASNSASLSACAPSRSIFSLGRSSSAHWLMFSLLLVPSPSFFIIEVAKVRKVERRTKQTRLFFLPRRSTFAILSQRYEKTREMQKKNKFSFESLYTLHSNRWKRPFLEGLMLV